MSNEDPYRDFKALVSDWNNRIEDLRAAKILVAKLEGDVVKAKEAISRHSLCPKEGRASVTIGMERPGRGHWTFLVDANGEVEKIPNVTAPYEEN